MSAPAISSGCTRWAAPLLGLVGLLGAHRFYRGRYQSGLVMSLTILAGLFSPVWAGTGKMETVADPHLFAEQARHLRTLGLSQIIGCLTGPNGKGEDVAPLCDHVVALDTMDSAGLASLFRWVSSSIATVGRQALGFPLPAPPREIRLIL